MPYLWSDTTGSKVKEKTREDLVNFAKNNGGEVVPFDQGDILESFDPVFKEGVCSGLATEYTRYIMKEQNGPKDIHTPENFIKKLNRKFRKTNGNALKGILKPFFGTQDTKQSNIDVSGKMKDRVSQYQTILLPQDKRIDEGSSILDAILPVKSSSANTPKSSFFNIFSTAKQEDSKLSPDSDVHSIDFLSPVKGNHETAIHYKQGYYIIFDPNLGIIKFQDREKCDAFLVEMKNFYCQGAGCSVSTINLSKMVENKGFGKRDGTKVDKTDKYLKDKDKKKFLIEYILTDSDLTEKHLLKAVEPLAEGDKLLSDKFKYNNKGMTLLEIAVSSENKDAFEVLLEKGVSEDIKKKALNLARKNNNQGFKGVLENSLLGATKTVESLQPESPATSSGNDANMNIFSQIGAYIYNKCSEIYQIISGAIFGTSNTPQGNILRAPASPPASGKNEKKELTWIHRSQGVREKSPRPRR